MKNPTMPGVIALAMALALPLGACAPSGADAELKEGWELMVAKDYPAARDHYEAMLTEYPDDPYAHLNLGVAYHQLGELDLAKRHYEAAIAEGGNAEISMVAEEGSVESRPDTVAEVARKNLDTIR